MELLLCDLPPSIRLVQRIGYHLVTIVCPFPGTINLHKARGCEKCETKRACKESSATCDCEYHEKLRKVNDNSTEMKIRRWALEDPNFPNEQVGNLDTVSLGIDL